MKKVDLIKIFIASPGDVKEQRDTVEKLIWEWNNEHTDFKNIVLMPIRWENNSTASYRINQDGQAVINEQILEDSDILIAIFGHKIGTRTMTGKSGTVEEINYFYNKYKRGVGVFFVENDTIPKRYLSEYAMVEAYKKFSQDEHRGIYDSFDLSKIRTFITKEVNSLMGIHQNSDIEVGSLDYLTVFNENEFDEDERLLLIFISESQTRLLGARWRAGETTLKIEKWEEANELNDLLSQNYQSALSKLEEKKLIYPKEHTEYGNVRLYALDASNYKQIKTIISSSEDMVNIVKKRNYLERSIHTDINYPFELPF